MMPEFDVGEHLYGQGVLTAGCNCCDMFAVLNTVFERFVIKVLRLTY